VADLRECNQPGCRVKGSWASFTTPDGRRWCISHNPDGRAKQEAVSKGGFASARKRLAEQPLDLSTPEAQAHVLELVAGGVLFGKQAAKAGAVVVAAVNAAAKVYELANLDRRLRDLERAESR
jgi:hypothetical protein